ncbi:hypothetical protein KKE19_01005 [Patescibacteria group bacterium]|nr:hypothetical protein [Patescibacteria group bacterium]MBU4367519.1 hypothetical protein [Patescibacteria group bacterium]MBU4461560.1 hypothetical protein [Patescibacteria group bacterium]MCG2699457.1 hypothetical protein [Candidatus Parcubacteria bacterium]
MDLYEDAKNLIKQSKNIYILPSQEKEESIISALALFYTLKELNKNVNLIVDEIPERLKFLIPSLDYISYPRNFVIALPNNLAEISQIRYEKDEKDLKIYLTTNKGNIKKSDISFSFTAPKADLLITIGVKELNQNNQSGFTGKDFLSNTAILNIDNKKEGESFGKINLVKENGSLTEIVFSVIKLIDENLIKKDIAISLLAGLIVFSNNFQSKNISSEILEIAAFLTKKGESINLIANKLYQQESLPQIKFLGQVLNNLNVAENNKASWAVLDNLDCQNLVEKDITTVVERLKNNFDFRNLFVLWKSHSSEPVSKGFFYSENYDLIKKAENEYQGTVKNNNIFFLSEKRGLDSIKNGLLKIITS